MTKEQQDVIEAARKALSAVHAHGSMSTEAIVAARRLDEAIDALDNAPPAKAVEVVVNNDGHEGISDGDLFLLCAAPGTDKLTFAVEPIWSGECHKEIFKDGTRLRIEVLEEEP